MDMIEVEGLVKHYRGRGAAVRAVDGISFQVGKGETLGLVGESGCGKSTTARMLVRLDTPTAGRIRLGGEDVTQLRGRDLRRVRRRIQLVFQDPYSSLNPRLTVGSTLAEVLSFHGMKTPVGELLDMVGLAAGLRDRYPHQLSGGQRQRVGIARALAVNPEILVLDEPVSALDVSVRAEVMNLLAQLRTDLGLTYVFISHDLGMVRHLCDRIAVMYLGKIVELGDWKQVSDSPAHPYAQSLRAAIPQPNPLNQEETASIASPPNFHRR
jgi:ABC-type oligopeptide transport system ATPase subunit